MAGVGWVEGGGAANCWAKARAAGVNTALAAKELEKPTTILGPVGHVRPLLRSILHKRQMTATGWPGPSWYGMGGTDFHAQIRKAPHLGDRSQGNCTFRVWRPDNETTHRCGSAHRPAERARAPFGEPRPPRPGLECSPARTATPDEPNPRNAVSRSGRPRKRTVHIHDVERGQTGLRGQGPQGFVR